MSLGIYIHIPFCYRRCSYCDFFLTTNIKLIDTFTDNLVKEIELFCTDKKLLIDSIYLGGGTPSILNTKQFEKIMNGLSKNFIISEKSEISIECNPEDIIKNRDKIEYFRYLGVNRVSIGVQSFIDKELSFLSRVHSSNQAIESVKVVSDLYYNYSVDLIYDLPNQTFSSVKYNISLLEELGVPHVSAYTLIKEKGTLMYKKLSNSKLSENEFSNENLYFFLNDNMAKAGYHHYEISNYSYDGFESKHNSKYWLYKEYIGFGPSSHSFFNGKRWNNFYNLKKYFESIGADTLPVENVTTLSLIEKEEDFFICTLRGPGIDKNEYLKIFNKNFDIEYSKIIDKIVNLELGYNDNNFFKLNEKGFALADYITFEFVSQIRG